MINQALDEKITIFLAIYKGKSFLEEQLYSLIQQKYPLKIVASQDCDCKESKRILLKFAQTYSDKIEIILKSGPRRGFVSNFLSMACSKNYDANYYAYSDQDDIWYPNKLSRAVDWLKTQDNNKPLIWCSTTTLVDKEGHLIKNAEIFHRPPSFNNAIIQSIAAGSTMVFNHKTREFLRKAGIIDVVSHDWWTYQLVTGCGGICFYDKNPSIYYRQHNKNVIGSNLGIKNKFKRLIMLLQGKFYKWNTKNLQALNRVRYLLTKESQYIIDHYYELRQPNPFKRVQAFLKLRLYRHSKLQQLIFLILVFFNKI